MNKEKILHQFAIADGRLCNFSEVMKEETTVQYENKKGQRGPSVL